MEPGRADHQLGIFEAIGGGDTVCHDEKTNSDLKEQILGVFEEWSAEIEVSAENIIKDKLLMR